jgi:hypothetical protein
MKNLFHFSIFLLLVFGFLACDKCEIPETTQSGNIIHNVVVRENSTALTNFDTVLVNDDATNIVYDSIDVSFDGGLNFVPIDFSSYSLMAMKTRTNCSATFDRTVVIDDDNQTANYSIRINECPTCVNTIVTDNWVLVEKIPDTYTVTFDILP